MGLERPNGGWSVLKSFALMNAAKWIIDLMEHTGTEQVLLTHEELAVILGVGRATRATSCKGSEPRHFGYGPWP
ncbi:hypothetical protein ACVWZW_001236 [Bradyrhizobium sp. F1.13.4]